MNITERVAQLLHQACLLLPFTNYIPLYYLYHTLNPESPQLAKSGSTFVRSPPFWLDWSLLRRLPKTCVKPCLSFWLSCLGHYFMGELDLLEDHSVYRVSGSGSWLGSTVPVLAAINDKHQKSSPHLGQSVSPQQTLKPCIPRPALSERLVPNEQHENMLTMRRGLYGYLCSAQPELDCLLQDIS